MSFGFGSLISAKAALTIVKSSIEKTINQPMEKFDLIYKHKENKIDFRLFNYTDENKKFHEKIVLKYVGGEKICTFIKHELNNKMKNGENIDLAIISFPEKTCVVYYNHDGEKISKSYKL